MRHQNNNNNFFVFFVIVFLIVGVSLVTNSCKKEGVSPTSEGEKPRWEELKIPDLTSEIPEETVQNRLSSVQKVSISIHQDYTLVDEGLKKGLKEQLERVLPNKYSNLPEIFSMIVEKDIVEKLKPIFQTAGLEVCLNCEADFKIELQISAETWESEYEKVKISGLGKSTSTGRRERMVTGFKVDVGATLVADSSPSLNTQLSKRKSSPENNPIDLGKHPKDLAFSARDLATTAALSIIFRIDPKRIKPLLTSEKTEKIGFAALEALGMKAMPVFIAILTQRTSKKSCRKLAASALKQMDWSSNKQIEKISYLIETEEWAKLVRIGKPAVKPLILELESRVSRPIIRSLSELGDPEAVEPIIKTLVKGGLLTGSKAKWQAKGKNNKAWSGDAVEALGKLKNPKAIAPLIALMNYPGLQYKCAKSLQLITAKDFGRDQKKWQKWWQQNKAAYNN